MNRKTLLLLLVLLVLGAGIWWLSQRRADGTSTLSATDTTFAVADTAAIDKVFFAYKDGRQHTLKRVARAYWRLDDRYDVRPDMAKLLLETLNRMRVKSPVGQAARNNVVRILATSGIKVEVYQGEQLARTFYIAGTTSDELGTYAILAGAEDPYILHIPGFNGFLSTRFAVSPRAWRVVPIFRAPQPAVEEISVVAAQPDHSFTIRRASPQAWALDGLPTADTALLRSYTSIFRRIDGVTFLDSADRPAFDSLRRTPPTYVMTIRQQRQARPERIRLWTIPHDENNFLGITDQDSTELMLAQHFVFDKLLVKRTEFARRK